MSRRIVAFALAVSFAGCPCTELKRRRPLEPALVREAREATMQAWQRAQLLPIDLDDVEVLVAEDCESFFRSCWPYRARGCPGQTQVAAECAPTSGLVIISFAEPVEDWQNLAIHGLLHDALRQIENPDRQHTDPRIWATFGESTVEATARRLVE